MMLVLACAGPPDNALTWREQWELLILTEDGGLVDAQITVGNTGILRKQGHLRANRWSAIDSPILFSLDGGPGDVDISDSHDAVRVGSSLLGRYESGDNWTLRVSDETANAIIHIDPGGPEVPLATGMNDSGQWTMSTPITHGAAHGWFTAARRGGMFEGRSIALQRGGDGVAGPRRASFVMSNGISIGIDEQGEQRLAWARIGDMDIAMNDLEQSFGPNGEHILDFRPSADLVVSLRPTNTGGTTRTDEHLYAPERAIAKMAGLTATRTVRRADVEVVHEGATRSASGVVVQTN
jgi:hypothetical protein